MKAAIVGGGIVGAAIALELGLRGWETVVLDGAPRATPIAAGVLLPDSSQRSAHSLHASWSADCLAAWQGEWLELPLRRGAMFFARDRESEQGAERYAAWARAQGMDTQKISPSEISLPLGKEIINKTKFVLFLPDAMVLQTEKVLANLHPRINRLCERATKLLMRDGRVCGVRTKRQEIQADVVVGACGWRDWSWSPILPQLLPWQGERVLFEGFQEKMPLIQTGEGALASREDGTLWAGVSFREDASGKPLAGAIQKIIERATKWLPGLCDARIRSIDAGIRPGTADFLPLLGETEIPGFYLATGHGRGGILGAPFSARVLADIIEERGSPWQGVLSPDRDFSRAGGT